MARCLVTGHAGYIGTHLYRKLQDLGHDVLGIDLKAKPSYDILTVLKQDLDGGFWKPYLDFSPEYIFHLACFPRVGYSIDNPVLTMTNNVLTTSYVLNFARYANVKRVIYSSSSSIDGDGEGPKSPYALQKLTSETECKLYSELYGLDTVSLRYFNVYSKDQRVESSYATIVANWMQCVREGKNPFITGDGEQRRDMAHISDVISANIFAMCFEERFNGIYFDIGTGDNISINEMKKLLLKIKPNLEFDYIPRRKGESRNTKANLSRIKSYGWSPKVSIFEGLNECFNTL